jgi:hypothetical protein
MTLIPNLSAFIQVKQQSSIIFPATFNSDVIVVDAGDQFLMWK